MWELMIMQGTAKWAQLELQCIQHHDYFGHLSIFICCLQSFMLSMQWVLMRHLFLKMIESHSTCKRLTKKYILFIYLKHTGLVFIWMHLC